MTQPSRLEQIMENLAAAIRAVPSIRGVTDEAPREDAEVSPFKTADLPHVWVWEEDETPSYGGTSLLTCELPVRVQCVYPYSLDDRTRGLRAIGRKLKADLQAAISADYQRGFDEATASHHAVDTAETGSGIGPMPQSGYGLVELSYLVTYVRHHQNPCSVRPPS